jgi:hypothetical protein
MKKLMILAFAATMALGATSCKKNKDTCDCSTITDISKGSYTTEQFDAICDAASAADKIAGGSGCSLK